jgi:hypothetical protein
VKIARFLRAAAIVAAAAAAFLAAPGRHAEARGVDLDAPGVVTYPSGQVPDEATLANALADPSVTTVVFNPGANPFTNPIYVFRRQGLRLCGRTSNPADTTIDSSAGVAIILDECARIEISGLTIRSSAAAGECVRMLSVLSTEIESFSTDVTVRKCRLESPVPLRGLVRAKNLTVTDCRIEVTRTNGFGILWEDGEGLFVTRTSFVTSAGATGAAAVAVRGAQVSTAEGQRAKRILITRNRVTGDFATGFDLADVADVQVQRNVIDFPGATFTGNGGRVGAIVRRAAASALPDRFAIRSNRVRDAHTGIWLLNVGTGFVTGNDLRTSGTPLPDTRFTDTGGALRIALQGPVCNVVVDRNDLRALRSPFSDPACVVTPAGSEAVCFPETVTNRVEAGRDLYQGAP